MSMCLIIFSCKKENGSQIAPQAKSDAKKYAVNFSLSDFMQTVENMSAKGTSRIMSTGASATKLDSLKDHIQSVQYILYDSVGNPLKRISQGRSGGGGIQYHCESCDSDFTHHSYPYFNSTFGTIIDSIPAGRYKVVLLGIRDYPYYAMNSRNSDDANWDEHFNISWIGATRSLDYRPLSTTGDIFHKSFDLVVGNQDFEQSVKLNRVYGKLDIQITDAIPANADKFDFRFTNCPLEFAIGLGKASASADYGDPQDTLDYQDDILFHPIQIKASEKGTINFLSSRVIFGSDWDITVEIRCFDANNKLIARKFVSNVRVYANKKTILKGKLFDNKLQAGFNVTVNSNWDGIGKEINY